MNWVAYWRKNPHRFAKEYLEMSLFLYQKILIFMIERADNFMYIASRGQGKSLGLSQHIASLDVYSIQIRKLS